MSTENEMTLAETISAANKLSKDEAFICWYSNVAEEFDFLLQTKKDNTVKIHIPKSDNQDNAVAVNGTIIRKDVYDKNRLEKKLSELKNKLLNYECIVYNRNNFKMYPSSPFTNECDWWVFFILHK